jgi:DNA-binding PadR family transcriptional regulator
LGVSRQRLTDGEGTLLALVVRAGPLTAYQIARVYELSPVTNYNTSKGKIYPMIRRLKARGYLAGESVEADARGTERLKATAAGREAVRRWASEILPTHILLEDPLRTKIQSFELLSRDDRLKWCDRARDMLADKLAELDAYAGEVEVPFRELVHDGAVSALRARSEWLERVRHALARADGQKSKPARKRR